MNKASKIMRGIAYAGVLVGASALVQAEEEKVLNVYNWSDYVDPAMLVKFEKETGIKIKYDVFDSDDTLMAKLLTGHSGYDITVPTSNYMAKEIAAGIFQKLDKSKLSNYGNIDTGLTKNIENADPGMQYSVPYFWGTTGIGYNIKKIEAILGKTMPANEWDLFYKPEYLSKIAKCGVSVLDSGTEIFPSTLKFLGLDPNSHNPADYKKAAELLKTLRPYIGQFSSSTYINDLAQGDICFAVGWSGDISIAGKRAKEAKNDVTLRYVIPSTGAPEWFDMLTIPKDAAHPENAHKFIDFMLRADVAAANTNFVFYGSPNKAAVPMIDKNITNDPNINPSDEIKAKLYLEQPLPSDVMRTVNRLWTDLKTGRL